MSKSESRRDWKVVMRKKCSILPNHIFYFSDITCGCGKEKIPIPCINEMDDVAAPLDLVFLNFNLL